MIKNPARFAASWLQAKGWRPFRFQRDVWRELGAGNSGLLHASTGSGKTYAVWLGALQAVLKVDPEPVGLRVFWLTPMRALATDTARALSEPVESLNQGRRKKLTVGVRTGDTTSAQRQRQQRSPPFALVTTPESLSLMISQADSVARLTGVQVVIVDEWHELMGNKRGVQVQLALARLQRLNPDLIVWGLSATLGNLPHALKVLRPGRRPAVMIEGRVRKKIVIDTLLPCETERFPWGGHLGIRMLGPVVTEIEAANSCLVFCNTRSQAEIWYQSILERRPDWAGLIALHHGSLASKVRAWVEQGLKDGLLKAVVCTSSLDLGVDFSPVERVLQIGSAKGVARLLQRAGRSGHSPGRPSRITLVPTNALELIESAAAQDAVAAGCIESRDCPEKPFDVLVQHLVTVALGTGFTTEGLHEEVRNTWAYRNLSREEFLWAQDFVTRGGPSLTAYPEYQRVQPGESGDLNVFTVPDSTIARRHRMSIGTIVSDASIQVRYLSGGLIGTVEESFISRLSRGDVFLFAGRLLELIRIHQMTAFVKRASGKKIAIPRWGGGRMPLSSELADAVLDRLQQVRSGQFKGREMRLLKPLLQLQMQQSSLPDPQTLLVEQWQSREGHHLFVYPFAGRQVHIGLASLLAWRVSRDQPATFSISVNDYGFELLSAEAPDWAALREGTIFDDTRLFEDVLASLNASELAQRRFREIARISGLVFMGFPGAPRSTRQLQASSSLFYEVFREHDRENLLLTQAEREVLEQELELSRLKLTMNRLRLRRMEWVVLERPTPLGFPLLVERFREKFTTEKLSDRIARMLKELEAQATP
ncbi:MAG: ligase-associated DNA damage response DEXH box helicase [Burkholderiaceae bacterium]